VVANNGLCSELLMDPLLECRLNTYVIFIESLYWIKQSLSFALRPLLSVFAELNFGRD
jgi:hypothetical protein